MASGILHLKDYRILASIGCAPIEHQKMQEISVEVCITFNKIPKDCMTDKLSDSYCYAHIGDMIKKVCAEKHYELIEHLSYSIFTALKKMMHPNKDKLEVKLHKLKPPLAELKGGAIFSCYDDK